MKEDVRLSCEEVALDVLVLVLSNSDKSLIAFFEIASKVFWCSTFGTISLVPLNRSPLLVFISSQKLQ